MKERPIIFSSPMVRAILGGTKTQTRRIAPIAELEITRSEYEPILSPGTLREFHGWFIKFQRKENGRTKGPKGVSCSTSGTGCSELEARQYIAQMYNPYGVPGDRLWVRETWNRAERTGYDATPNDGRPGFDESDPDAYNFGPCWYRATDEVLIEGGWKPSLFMPRLASRITLEIVSVRVERLQEISEEDAIAEGYREIRCSTCRGSGTHPYGHPCRCGDGYAETQTPPIEWYRQLWESIHGAGSWNLNPWVWCIEFKMVEVAR